MARTERLQLAQETLARLSILQHSPALSYEVYDALYSYYRLPLSTLERIEYLTPTFSKLDTDDSHTINLIWEEYLQLINAYNNLITPTEAATLIAIRAEQCFDGMVCHDDLSFFTTTTNKIKHGKKLESLLGLLYVNAGDYYLAFEVLITILESTLYDLYYDNNDQAKKNIILRDLLLSTTLEQRLPPGLLSLLRTLFLPSGLNLRNLVWHGFLHPSELPRCYGCLSALLLVILSNYLPRATRPTDSAELFHMHTYDHRFHLSSALAAQLDKVPSEIFIEQVLHSPYIPIGRHHLVARAFNAVVIAGDETLALFLLLPVLEHSLRLHFIEANKRLVPSCQSYAKAHVHQYFSTLDGFGQRTKHQVMLHPQLADTIEGKVIANALYDQLPVAVLSVLLDMFMMADGPNVRAKLCHGEASLDGLFKNKSWRETSVSTKLLIYAYCHLCDSATGLSDEFSKRPVFNKEYVSSFHPFLELQRKLLNHRDMAVKFNILRQKFKCVELEELDDDTMTTRVTFYNQTAAPQKYAAMTLPSSKVDEWKLVMHKLDMMEDDGRMVKSSAFSNLVYALDSTLNRIVDKMEEEYMSHHATCSSTSSFLSLLRHRSLKQESNILIRGRLSDQVEKALLALSDSDGLGVAPCMFETLESLHRCLHFFTLKAEELAAMVDDKSARTNHRKSLFTLICVFPVVEKILFVCLAAIEHHVVHLLETGLRNDIRCPHTKAYEQLQKKLLQFVTAFEGCSGSPTVASKSLEKGIRLASEFSTSKPMKAVTG